MAHYTRNIHEATVFEMQSSGIFDEQRAYQQQQRFSNEEGLVESSDCTAVNGVLALIPLSTVRLQSGSEFEHQAESSSTQSTKRKLPNWAHRDAVVQSQQHASGQASLPAADVVKNKKYFFRLFKMARAYEEYILEKHEIATGKMNRYHLSAVEEQGKWKVIKRRLTGQHDMYPVVIDPFPPVFRKKYNVPLHERLEGWSLEPSLRCNGATDKFYYHGETQCRSLVEVSKYILYSCKKMLIPFKRETSQEVQLQEAEAVEAMMILASEPVRNVNHQNLNVNDPPTENPIVLAGNEVDNENPIRNENLIATPQPHDNCVAEALPNTDQNQEEDELAVVAMSGSGEGRNGTPQESPSLVIQDEDIFTHLPEIENLNFVWAVDGEEISSNLPVIENLNLFWAADDEDLFANLAEIENLDEAVDKEEIFASLLDIENLDF